MKAYSIDPDTQEVKEIDIEIQANTVYTFLNSILTDEITMLDKHTVYSDAEAISKSQKPFLLGELIVVGKALVLGKDGFADIQASIPIDDLKPLVNFEVPAFYEKALNLLNVTDINLYRLFVVKDEQFDTSWVLHVFSVADENTQNYFLNELQKTIEAKEDISTYMQTMAGLAIKAMG